MLRVISRIASYIQLLSPSQVKARNEAWMKELSERHRIAYQGHIRAERLQRKMIAAAPLVDLANAYHSYYFAYVRMVQRIQRGQGSPGDVFFLELYAKQAKVFLEEIIAFRAKLDEKYGTDWEP